MPSATAANIQTARCNLFMQSDYLFRRNEKADESYTKESPLKKIGFLILYKTEISQAIINEIRI